MRNLILAVLAIGGWATAGDAPAAAETDYPFCMTTREGGRDCSFSNSQQCQASASGMGGYCFENPYLVGTHAESQPNPGRRPHRNY